MTHFTVSTVFWRRAGNGDFSIGSVERRISVPQLDRHLYIYIYIYIYASPPPQDPHLVSPGEAKTQYVRRFWAHPPKTLIRMPLVLWSAFQAGFYMKVVFYRTLQYSTIYKTVQYGTIQYGIVQYSTIQYNTRMGSGVTQHL